MIDIDPDTLGDVVGIYLIPAGPAQQPCLALRVIAGPKAYARVWLDRLDTVEWGWVLPSGAVRLWSDGRLDDTDERADAPPSGRGDGAAAIVRAMAGASPFAHDGSPDSEWWCPMCGAVPDPSRSDKGHDDRCPSALALAWVAEHPAGA